jgi:hypothetical protein
MDLVIAGFQGLGIAIALAALCGAVGWYGLPGNLLAALAAIAGGWLFGFSLTEDFGVADVADEDHPAWPGWIVGALVGLLAYLVWREVSAGAQSRAGSAGFIPVYITVLALALGVLVLLVPLASGIIGLVVTAWLALQRRRRAGEKYAGLRVLR